MRNQQSALLVVDVQKDFCSGGALPVPDGDRVVPPLNRLISRLERRQVPMYASRDWHPAESSHFKVHGGIWPVHCVANSDGARFQSALQLSPGTIIVSKGQQPSTHGYSAFDGVTTEGRSLLDDLKRQGVTHLYVGGLATDYCVRHSVLDALRAGFAVTLLTDAIAGVDVNPGDSTRALEEMKAAGATLTTTENLEI